MNVSFLVKDFLLLSFIQILSVLTTVVSFKILSRLDFFNLIYSSDVSGLVQVGLSIAYVSFVSTIIAAYYFFRFKLVHGIFVIVSSINAIFLISFSSKWFIPFLLIIPYTLIMKINKD